MKKNLNSVYVKLAIKAGTLAAAMIALLPGVASATGPGFGGNVNDGGVCVPLDGGLSMLAAAGIGYGIKKYTAAKLAKGKASENK